MMRMRLAIKKGSAAMHYYELLVHAAAAQRRDFRKFRNF